MTTKKVTYNEAISEIEMILEKIENEELDVDELAEKVKRVSALLKICKNKLTKNKTEPKITMIFKFLPRYITSFIIALQKLSSE